MVRTDEHGLPHVDPALIAAARQATEASNRYPENPQLSNISACFRYGLTFHYFHFMEIVIVLYSYIKEFAPNAKLDKIYVGLVAWTPLHEAIVAALFSDIKIEIFFEDVLVDNLIYIDVDDMESPINKFIDPMLAIASKWGPQMRRDVYSSIGVAGHSKNNTEFLADNRLSMRCMYSKRKPPRCFSDSDELKIMDILSAKTNMFIAEFGNTPWCDQVHQASTCDLMFGIHGNGLTNLLWLPPHATVVEIFPRDAHHYDYQMMCEVMGLNYYGIEHETIFRDFSRFGPSYGHLGETNVMVPLPSDEILDLVFSAIGI